MYSTYNVFDIPIKTCFCPVIQNEEASIQIFQNETGSGVTSLEEEDPLQKLNKMKSLTSLIRIHSYTGDATIKFILEELEATDLSLGSSSDKLKELADILDFLSENYGFYDGPYLDYVLDEDSDELLFFRIIFANAGKKEWKEIENSMARLQVLTKGYLAVFCMKGFEL